MHSHHQYLHLKDVLLLVTQYIRGGSRIFLGGGAPLRNGVTNTNKPHLFAEYQLY